MKVLISVIVPTYNAEKYIIRLLQSVIDQQFVEMELLIHDHLSTDGTVELIKGITKDFHFIRVISEKDNGIYDAMNRGIQSAKGEWLYFMGCDDQFHDPNVLKKVKTYLEAEVDVVYGDVQWMPGDEIEAGICTPEKLLSRNINHQRIFYRRSIFKKYGEYNLHYKIASDYELNIRFFCIDEIRKKYIPLIIADYHASGFSANKVDTEFWDDWKPIYKANFLKHIPIRRMYEKLGWYCRYQIEQKNYAQAFLLFLDVLLHTFSPGFIWLTGKQFLQSFKKHAS